MALPHRILKPVFALAIGLLLAFYAYQRAGDPELRVQREREEAAVAAAREVLESIIGSGIEIVDPLAPRRAVGKAFVYPAGPGWEISGHYRRDRGDPWHPFLLRLDTALALRELSVRDPALANVQDARLTVVP